MACGNVRGKYQLEAFYYPDLNWNCPSGSPPAAPTADCVADPAGAIIQNGPTYALGPGLGEHCGSFGACASSAAYPLVPDTTWPPPCAAGLYHSLHFDLGWTQTDAPVGTTWNNACYAIRQAVGCFPGDTFEPNAGVCLGTGCADDECWCNLTCTCVPCSPPTGDGVHGCRWDPDSCDWTDCETCPEGQCWCEASETCVDCTDPECKEQLHCTWDKLGCNWHCDDPDTICGPNRSWLGAPDCKCEGSGGVWNLHTPIGHYHIADDLAGIRYRRAEDTVPPFTLDVAVTADTTDRSPRMVRDFDGRIILVWLRGTDALEAVSDDEGETWGTPETIAMGVSQVTIAKDKSTGLILRGFLDSTSGELTITRQYPGDPDPSAPIACLVNPGATALTLDDAGFHFSWAPEGPGRWLLVGVSAGAAVNFASSDDGATWEEL